ncbi:MAG: hypothetical protein KGO81_01205 [Bacteroidota bacterium]|nr:hypothetical protein [Bacteroidota bacterium]
MKKTNVENTQLKQDLLIQHALRTGGFVFPQTVAEVESFEKKFGTTDVQLPEELQTPVFLNTPSKKTARPKVIKIQQENLAMAAREEMGKLPKELLSRIENDIKEADKKSKQKKAKKK